MRVWDSELANDATTRESVESARPQTPLQQLQRSLGNSVLLQRRNAIQRRPESLPEWLKHSWNTGEQIPSEVEQQHAAQQQVEAANEIHIPGGGRPLEPAIQARAEEHLGVPMGDVQVVTDGDAACEPIGAMAFATHDGGTPKVVLSSSVDLNSQDGQFTLMHELTHIAQQKQGRADDLHGMDGDSATRDHLENHADAEALNMLGR